MLEFKINDFIMLKLEKEKSNIYILGKRFMQCKYLLLNIPIKKVTALDEIESIDEAAETLDETMEWRRRQLKIPPEVEFWGHCSNTQIWAEHNYDTRLLHRNLAFPLLKKLTEVGDPLAKKVFKKEILKRFESNYPSVLNFLIEEGYLTYFDNTELSSLILKENGDLKDSINKLLKVMRRTRGLEKAIVDLVIRLRQVGDPRAKKFIKKREANHLERKKRLQELNELISIGDQKAKQIIKEEIALDNPPVIRSLMNMEYIDVFETDELRFLIFEENWEFQDYIEEYLIIGRANLDKKRLHFLKKLIDLGDSFAKKVFKKEVTKQIENYVHSIISTLLDLDTKYSDVYEEEEFRLLFFKENWELQDSISKYFKVRPYHEIAKLELLKNLINLGDSKAKDFLKEEIAKQIENGDPSVIKTLIDMEYAEVFDNDELSLLIFKENGELKENILIDTTIRYQLLEKFCERGVPKAKELIKKDLVKQIEDGNPSVIRSFIDMKYTKYFDIDELRLLIFKENWELQDSIKNFLEARREEDKMTRFQLLKKLSDGGDLKAKEFLIEEIPKKLEIGNLNEICALIRNNYLELFNQEELEKLFLDSTVIYRIINGFELNRPGELELMVGTLMFIKDMVSNFDEILSETYLKKKGNKDLINLFITSISKHPEKFLDKGRYERTNTSLLEIVKGFRDKSILYTLIENLTQYLTSYKDIFTILKNMDLPPPIRLIESLGKGLIYLRSIHEGDYNIEFNDYIGEISTHLYSFYRMVINGYYSTDFNSLIDKITDFLDILWSYLIFVPFQLDEFIGEYGDAYGYFFQDCADIFLNDYIEIKIQHEVLVIEVNSPFAAEEDLEIINELNKREISFILNQNKIFEDNAHEQDWLKKHIKKYHSKDFYGEYLKKIDEWKN